MRNTFKISTFVLKLALFSFIMSSIALMSVKVQAKSENDKMIDQHVRLSLWYVGLDKPSESSSEAALAKDVPEELARALLKLKSDQTGQ